MHYNLVTDQSMKNQWMLTNTSRLFDFYFEDRALTFNINTHAGFGIDICPVAALNKALASKPDMCNNRVVSIYQF